MADPMWDSYNEFLLHGEANRFAKMFARYELFQKIMNLPGDIVEAGVFKGAGVLYWAKLVEIFNPQSTRRVIGFDTFQGYPETNREYERDSGKKFEEDADYDPVSSDAIMEIAASLNLSHRIELVKGDAAESVLSYVNDNPGFRVALVNMDFDTYDPTAACLQHLYPLVVPKGVVAFDNYAIRGWGESDAADSFFRDKSVVLHSFSWANTPTAFFQKEA